jgi:hypothetical protein
MGLSALGIEYGSYLLVAAIFLLLLTGQPLAWVTGLVALIFTFGWFAATPCRWLPPAYSDSSPSTRWWRFPCSF